MSRYSKQFKLKAVHAYLSQNRAVADVARSLDIHKSQLSDWLLVYRHHGADGLAPRQQWQDYTPAFKLKVINYKRQHRASLPEVATHFHIPSASTIFEWEKRYNLGGIDALTTRRGRPTMKKMKKSSSDPKVAKKPWSELTQPELLREIEYLQAENAYLKKLEALIQQEKSVQSIKPMPSED
ncbi:MAG: hypothetical protein RIS84_1906 [Pseudomonadota bacterium]|jgi:transposase